MTAGTDALVQAFRLWVTDNVPPSGANWPNKAEIIAGFQRLAVDIGAAQAGLTTVSTIAARDTFYATPANQGKLVYVNNNNGSATDPANGVYEYVSGAARLAQGFYAGLTAVVQPLVNDAIQAAGFILRADAVTFSASSMSNGESTKVYGEAAADTHAALAGEFGPGNVAVTVGTLIPNNGFYTRVSGVLLRKGDLDSQAAKTWADAAAASAALAASALAGLLTPSATGRPSGSTLVAGTNITAQTTFAWNSAATARRLAYQLRGYFGSTGVVTVAAANLVGGIFVPIKETIRKVGIGATGVQTVTFAPFIREVGQYLVITNGVNSMFRLITATGDSGGYYLSVNTLVNTSGALNTTSQLQLGIDEYIIGDVFNTVATYDLVNLKTALATFLGSDFEAGNVAALGSYGAFVTTLTGANGTLYMRNEINVGYFNGYEIEMSTGGTGKLYRFSAGGETLDVADVTFNVGGNWFPATIFGTGPTDNVWNSSWYVALETTAGGFARSDSGVGGVGTLRAPYGPYTKGQVITFGTSTTARQAQKVYGRARTLQQQIASAGSGGSASSPALKRRLPDAMKPRLLLGGAFNHILTYGQSNSTGADATPIITTASTRHKKLQYVRFNYTPAASGANVSATWNGTTVSDLSEDTVGETASAADGETPLTSLAKSLTRRIGATGPDIPIFLCSAAGKGATDIATLAGAWLNQFRAQINGGITAAKAAGVEYQVLSVVMDHGEQDQNLGTSKATYYATSKTMMETIQAYYETQTAAAGGSVSAKTNKIIWLWSTAGKSATSQKGIGVAEAQLQLCDDLPYCVYYGPSYRYPYITGNGSHLTARGQALKGAGYAARAIHQLLNGYQPDRIRWGSAIVNGTALTVYATGPTALQLNADLTGALTNSGFAVQDDTGTLTLSGIATGTPVVSANGDYVTPINITLNRALGTNPFFRCAKDFLAGTDPAGGAMSNLRDSTADTITLADGSTHVTAHCAPPVTLPIYAYE